MSGNRPRMWLGFVLLCCAVFVDRGSSTTPATTEQQYCPYFQNRKPERQDNLKNCTWYKENACCSAAELHFSFRQLTTLPGASDECQRHLNYLYCYICAPNQNSFFYSNTLTVCEEFCDGLFRACGGAELKGRKIGDAYENGTEFCRSRRFQVDKKANGKCFFYDGHRVTSGGKGRVGCQAKSFSMVLFVTLFTKALQ